VSISVNCSEYLWAHTFEMIKELLTEKRSGNAPKKQQRPCKLYAKTAEYSHFEVQDVQRDDGVQMEYNSQTTVRLSGLFDDYLIIFVGSHPFPS
jgi:hypothetical protein